MHQGALQLPGSRPEIASRTRCREGARSSAEAPGHRGSWSSGDAREDRASESEPWVGRSCPRPTGQDTQGRMCPGWEEPLARTRESSGQGSHRQGAASPPPTPNQAMLESLRITVQQVDTPQPCLDRALLQPHLMVHKSKTRKTELHPRTLTVPQSKAQENKTIHSPHEAKCTRPGIRPKSTRKAEKKETPTRNQEKNQSLETSLNLTWMLE